MNDPTSAFPYLAFSAVLNGIELYLYQGDILQVGCEVIVNAANDQLMHGGGLALLLHQAAGPGMDNESKNWIRNNGKIKDGEIAWTDSYNLAPYFKKIIHAVGPQGPDSKAKQDMMFSTIMKSILKTAELGFSSIVFPALSVGIFNYPKEIAAKVHLDVFVSYAGAFALNEKSRVTKIAFAILQPDIALEFVNSALERSDVFHKMFYYGLLEDFNFSLEFPMCKICKFPMQVNLFQIFQNCFDMCDVCYYANPGNSCSLCAQPPMIPANYQHPQTHRICRKCFNFYRRGSNHICNS